MGVVIWHLKGGAALVDTGMEGRQETLGFVYEIRKGQAAAPVPGRETLFKAVGLRVHLQIEDGDFVAADAA